MHLNRDHFCCCCFFLLLLLSFLASSGFKFCRDSSIFDWISSCTSLSDGIQFWTKPTNYIPVELLCFLIRFLNEIDRFSIALISFAGGLHLIHPIAGKLWSILFSLRCDFLPNQLDLRVESTTDWSWRFSGMELSDLQSLKQDWNQREREREREIERTEEGEGREKGRSQFQQQQQKKKLALTRKWDQVTS